MACKCARIENHVREELVENYGLTETWSLAAVRAEGRERLYRCGECGAWFFMGRPLGAMPGEQEVVYFRLPQADPKDFAALDTRPYVRAYYRDRLAREMPIEEEGTCAALGCAEPALRSRAYCVEHVLLARAGWL